MVSAFRSYLEYNWRKISHRLARRTSLAALSLIIAAIAAPTAAQEAGIVTLNDITQAIVPTSTNTGDRDFNGTPVIVMDVQLNIGQRGRAIYATVGMTARRGNLRTFTRQQFLVWRWNPAEDIRVVRRILTPGVTIRFDDLPGTCGFGCARVVAGGSTSRPEDGGLIVDRDVPGRGLVRQVRLLGDTMGDDISTDQNPHGDTSIRSIRFRPIRVEFSRGLRG